MKDPERWRRVEHVLDAVLTSQPDRRREILDEECAGDAALRQEVESLLDSADRAEKFLNIPPSAAAAAAIAEAGSGNHVGRRVGAYRLVREIGHGGMSRVYRAERDDGAFVQQVAVKLLRSNLDSDADQHRFRAERQILATLNHPNIARLIDGGVTDDGLPFLVLELVNGKPIDAWCNEHALGIAERLELFQTVARATQHAHNNLVVHRDLKPSNIFVDDDGVVKLLDFGIAKLLDPSAAPSAPQTRAGHHWMTPEYAAPEQIRSEPVNTLTDVYQLAAVLYQLASGKLPFGVVESSQREFEDRVLLRDAPSPSSVATPASPMAAMSGSARRELDAIVMKGLSKEPNERYASATAMVDDIQRFRDGRPVLAAAGTTTYRIRKFVRRHRKSVAVAAGVVLVLAAAAFRERGLRSEAEGEAHKATAVEQYLVNVFDVADPFAPPDPKLGETSARAILDRGAGRIDSVLADEPEVQAELRGVIGRVYGSLGMFDRAAPMFQRALDQQRALHGNSHADVATAEDHLGEVLFRQDQFDKAEPLLLDALAQRRALLGSRDTATAISLDHLGALYQERNDYDKAILFFREALDIRRAVLGDSDVAVANSTNQLGLAYWSKGEYDKAEPFYRSALAIMQRRLGENHPTTASVIHNLAQLKQMQGGQVDEAIALYRRALAAKQKSLGKAHPSVTVNMNNLASLIARERGQLDEAEQLVREALAMDRQTFGEQHSYVAASLDNLATILRMKGNFTEAEQTYRQAFGINRAMFGSEHTAVAFNLNNLANVRQLSGDPAGAVVLFRESVAMYGKLLGEQHPNYTTVRVNLARALREAGNTAEAEKTFRDLEAHIDSGKQRLAYINTEIGLARILLARGETDKAQPMLERALASARKGYGEESWRTAEAKLVLGTCLAASGKRAAADSLFQASYEVLRKERGQPLLGREAQAAVARGS
ncbi:MAG: serine/threonine-protein kinase [Gemmatimonadaceae bacterium]